MMMMALLFLLLLLLRALTIAIDSGVHTGAPAMRRIVAVMGLVLDITSIWMTKHDVVTTQILSDGWETLN
jgi:hypothetical protein